MLRGDRAKSQKDASHLFGIKSKPILKKFLPKSILWSDENFRRKSNNIVVAHKGGDGKRPVIMLSTTRNIVKLWSQR